ncbi:MAG: DUF2341 domain-containing protein [Verrucomicrobiaceae bacterium]|nr:DUF2341 domain-containing protein [Verrucomicrobiaceae bacterium]
MLKLLCLLTLSVALHAAEEKLWLDPGYTIRKKIDIDTKAAAITDPLGTSAVLVRLHEGVFSFLSAREDGGDLRFTADDHKTVLKHHVEKWDSLLNEAYVWVQVPDLKPAAATTIWLYYGNAAAPAAEAAKETYTADSVLVYHFADAAKVASDSSPTGANAEGAPPPAAGALIGSGLRVFGQVPVKTPAPPLPDWFPGGPLTISLWVKPSALAADAVFARPPRWGERLHPRSEQRRALCRNQ